MKSFEPPSLLKNPHAMTIAAVFWRRKFARLPVSQPRFFETEPGTLVRADCHWQPNPTSHPTLVLLHGLEGSSESGYMLGCAEKAWVAGFNVLRLNQRNCGGTERLTPTLYHSGLSIDIRNVVAELAARDSLPEIFAAGFSMGGNLVLKMAGEWAGDAPRQLRAVVAIAPALDLAACADALAEPRNFIYEWHFVRNLRRHMRYKARLFPERYPDREIQPLSSVRTVREFDDVITAKFCGFRDAGDYYDRSSAKNVVAAIARPALLLTSQDDPFVPFESFDFAALRENPSVEFVASRHGGHCGFIARQQTSEGSNGIDRFWVESRLVEFCASHSRFKK
jgi:uncharacterized protein